MTEYDITVIGGGPAGAMAAIKAAESGKRTALLERNDSIGRKIMITGKGRCNLTNTAPIETLVGKFKPGGQFYRTAFYEFSADSLVEFFREGGLELKAERQGRIFPVTDKAKSVVLVLEERLKASGAEVLCNTRVVEVRPEDGRFALVCGDGRAIGSKKVVIASGGASYKATGSTGDGHAIARKLGHKVSDLKPGLVPLVTKERWVKDLQGLGLENIRISFDVAPKKLMSPVGELMFTHFGISGPLVLDLSQDVAAALDGKKEIAAHIDMKPGLRKEQLESKLVHKFTVKGSAYMKNVMQDILPKKLIPVFLALTGIDGEKRANQVTKDERRVIIDLLKALPLTVTGSLPLEEAMVTAGGVSMKEINPRTMESKVVPGLYFAGEVIEGAAPSGGYNLQKAFSTGYLAGEKAAESI